MCINALLSKKKYIKGIKSPLTRKKRIEIASLKLSEKYPLLTVENVQYWYWKCDPKWSGHDIAKVIGCHFQTVYNFMEKHGIPIRDYSNAGKVMF